MKFMCLPFVSVILDSRIAALWSQFALVVYSSVIVLPNLSLMPISRLFSKKYDVPFRNVSARVERLVPLMKDVLLSICISRRV